jgi:hypothetical protein
LRVALEIFLLPVPFYFKFSLKGYSLKIIASSSQLNPIGFSWLFVEDVLTQMREMCSANKPEVTVLKCPSKIRSFVGFVTHKVQ